jgi:hypothetical protein
VQDWEDVQGEWCVFYWKFCEWQGARPLLLHNEQRLILQRTDERQHGRMLKRRVPYQRIRVRWIIPQQRIPRQRPLTNPQTQLLVRGDLLK